MKCTYQSDSRPTGPERLDEGRIELAGIAVRACVSEKVVPAVRDRRDSTGQVVREQLVQVDDAGVLGEAAQSTAERAFEAGAELGRAEVGLVVDYVQVGRAADEGEEVLAVVRVDGKLIRTREPAR